MPLTFAFDVYGTLIDTAGVTESLNRLVGDQAALFSSRWRDKQLEYSFRRGLMQDYVDFSVCTRQALAYTATQLNLPISDQATQALLDEYRRLPAFPDVPSALERLQADGHRLYAFSNGLPDDLEALLDSAGIREAFIDIVSVHEIRTFKPNPAVYRHFLARSGTDAADSCLVSSNPFDLLGGMAVSMRTAWIRRSDANHFDPWDRQPDQTLASLTELQQAFNE
ncbi:haloacid dehalogenase type II [Sedimenticola sp.]|uniref:haloacid dehalogenase type II n=1 Tax=Sedimenticola sp. TaxID=1940285 RepID=UPI003D0BC3F6